MLIEGNGHPGMRELQQGGATRAEKESRLAIDAPGDGVGAENAVRLDS